MQTQRISRFRRRSLAVISLYMWGFGALAAPARSPRPSLVRPRPFSAIVVRGPASRARSNSTSGSTQLVCSFASRAAFRMYAEIRSRNCARHARSSSPAARTPCLAARCQAFPHPRPQRPIPRLRPRSRRNPRRSPSLRPSNRWHRLWQPNPRPPRGSTFSTR